MNGVEAREPFDVLVKAAALLIYGGEPPSALRRLAFRLAMLGATALILGILWRHGAVPELWHRITYALWLAFGTVMMRGEKALGDRRLHWAAATGLTLGIGFVAWLAFLRDWVT